MTIAAFFSLIILKILPLLLLFLLLQILFYYHDKNKLKNYINYIYVFKFLIFNILLLLYYVFYILIFFVYFIFKNSRFFKYYYSNISTAFFYYKKKSIYFLFWRYLVHSLFFIFFLFFKYFYNNIKKIFLNIFFINNVYLVILILLKTKYYINNNFLIKFLFNLYNGYIYFIYHFFNFLNIDEMFNIIKLFNFNILNILKYVKDPILNRNIQFTWFTSFMFTFYKEKKTNIFKINNTITYGLFLKYILSLFMYSIYNFNLFEKNDKKFYKLLSFIYLYNKINLLNLFYYINKLFKSFIYFINLFFINFIYFIILNFTYLIYIVLDFLLRCRNIIMIFILILICIKYYWIFYYYFFLLYKHYLLYIPLFQVKESTRFFNFEWIDLRNYFNLIFLHNTLVDLSIFNNIIYNDLLNNLNKTLSVYGFKIGNQYDVNLYAMLNVYNKDTILLDNLLNVFNKSNSVSLWKWHNRLKKLFTNKAQMLFKFNKKNYKNSKFFQKPLEQSIKHNSVKQEGLTHLGLNRENLFKNNYKHNFIIWKMYNKNYFKKIVRNYISLNTSNIKKVKKIPLKYIYLFNNNNFIIYKKNIFNFIEKWKKNLYFSKRIKKYLLYFLREYYKINVSPNSIFYFGRIYNFKNYKNKMQMKSKIPTFEWTALRWRRKNPNHLYFNASHVLTLDEHQKWYSFYELAKKKIKKKRVYKINYINYQYPFSLNYNHNILESLSYLKQLESYIKIIKKYYYIKNTKIYFMKRYYKKLLHTNNLVLKSYIYRLKNWNDPFFKKQLSSKTSNELHFWYFFDYFKIDKYYYIKNKDIYKEETDLTLYFIKKTRKDYIKLRNHLLRMYSLFFHYYHLERSYFKHYVPMTLKKTKALIQLKNKRVVWNYESFKINWMLKIYLTRQRVNKKSFKNINIISKLFKQHFFAYFIYCDYTINTYNDLYYIKITSYNLKVLNKINNLKRFFYFQNKYTTGSSIFKYLNSFSLAYHIKHFLWNSPYSFLFFQEDFVSNLNYINKDVNINALSYKIEKKDTDTYLGFIINIFFEKEKEYLIVNFHNYSMLFNLFANTIALNSNWYNINIYHDNIDSFLYLISFSNYYNCGYSIFKPFYIVDIYRFIINFIFEYYTNFLYKLTRYRYILDYKNYTLYTFLKYYFNFENKINFYLKIRITAIDLKFISRLFKYLVISKNKYSHNAYKKTLIPFWFIFDYYIKLFIYFLLNKYYVKEFFVYYWIYKFKNYFILNCDLVYITIFFFALKLFIYKYFYIFLFDFNVSNFIITYFNLFNSFIFYYWYCSLVFQFNIDYLYLLDNLKINLILKWIILNWVQLDLYKYNLNKIIFIKLYLEKLLTYYLKIFFNLKNTFVFFKPNYIYYRKQRNHRILNRIKFNDIIFNNTITYRNKATFKHLTNNILFFKNIYLTNVYNYVYLLNVTNINIENFTNLFFYLFKYNYIYLNVFIYVLLYWLVWIFLFIFYKKFLNIFFFCNFENSNYEYNWNKLFNDSAVKLSKKFHKKDYIIFKNVNIKNSKNFYSIFFTTFFKKLSFINNIKYKILFLKNKHHNQKYWNNNTIVEIPNNFKLLIWPYTFLHKYIYNLFNNISKMPIIIKKENKNYNFYFYDFLNNNLFNFCIFYWFLLIPYFFFEYVLMKYHLKGHVLIKRRVILILKVFLDNFKWFIKLFKIIGDGVNVVFKHRHPKTYKGVYVTRNRKKLKFGYFFKWDRMHKQRLHISPLGSYYYWFFKINKIEYFLNIRKYFFNVSIKSNYFYWINIYFLLFFIIKKKFYKKFLNFNFIFKNLNKYK